MAPGNLLLGAVLILGAYSSCDRKLFHLEQVIFQDDVYDNYHFCSCLAKWFDGSLLAGKGL
jgi:hypothetical protein